VSESPAAGRVGHGKSSNPVQTYINRIPGEYRSCSTESTGSSCRRALMSRWFCRTTCLRTHAPLARVRGRITVSGHTDRLFRPSPSSVPRGRPGTRHPRLVRVRLETCRGVAQELGPEHPRRFEGRYREATFSGPARPWRPSRDTGIAVPDRRERLTVIDPRIGPLSRTIRESRQGRSPLTHKGGALDSPL
jgi:hypothetical protein